jgi:hypothetical protein
MTLPPNYQRLLEATQRFNNFNLFVDLVALSLFIVVSIASANKLLAKKILDSELFDLSWRTIAICSFIFLILLVNRLYNVNRRRVMRRVLTSFEQEAAIKAARKNNYKKR